MHLFHARGCALACLQAGIGIDLTLWPTAHNEALQKEVQRLRQLYQQQHQNMQQQQHSQSVCVFLMHFDLK